MALNVSTFQALRQLDSNRNGLSVAELKRADHNGDGQFSAAEASAAGFAESDRALINQRYRGKLPQASAFVFNSREMDALQVVAPLHTHFRSLDSNGDRLLSSSELGKALGNPVFKGEEAAAITAAYKTLGEFKALSDDTGWLPQLPQNTYLDKIPLHTYDERGISAGDLSRFLDLAGQNDSRVDSTLGRFSVVSWTARESAQPLFAQGLDSIRPDQIQQGELGDCYFLAAVASLANTPSGKKQIHDMIKPLANDRYQISFPGRAPITINAPTLGERALYSNAGQDGAWLSVLEKGYAEVRKRDSLLIKRSNPYDQIGNGGQLSTGIRHITGQGSDTDVLLLTSESTLRSKLERALAQHQIVTVGTLGKLPWQEDTTANGLPMGHAYSVLAYDRKTDQVTVRNPWGNTEVSDGNGPRDGRDDGTFQMPLSEFKASFSMVSYQTR